MEDNRAFMLISNQIEQGQIHFSDLFRLYQEQNQKDHSELIDKTDQLLGRFYVMEITKGVDYDMR